MNLTRERIKIAEKLRKQPETPFEEIDLAARPHPIWMTRCFRNNRYTVMIMDDHKTTKGNAIRAMVQAHDDQPIKNHWAEMQRIKSEVFGPEVTAIEYYPKASELIDQHNIYWLWIFPEGVLPEPIKP